MKKYEQHEVSTRPAQLYDRASTIRAKTFIAFITLIGPAINILADAVFGTGIFYWYRAGTLRYKSEGRWFDPRWCHWNFH